jgi:hypothetical protein
MTCAGFCGQVTLERELEPMENHEKKHERSEPISELEDVCQRFFCSWTSDALNSEEH